MIMIMDGKEVTLAVDDYEDFRKLIDSLQVLIAKQSLLLNLKASGELLKKVKVLKI